MSWGTHERKRRPNGIAATDGNRFWDNALIIQSWVISFSGWAGNIEGIGTSKLSVARATAQSLHLQLSSLRDQHIIEGASFYSSYFLRAGFDRNHLLSLRKTHLHGCCANDFD